MFVDLDEDSWRCVFEEKLCAFTASDQAVAANFFANREVETVTAAHQGHFYEAHSVVPFILYCIAV